MEETIFRQFKSIGRDLFLKGLVNSHSGNMSMRIGNNFYITRRASMLGRLKRQDIVEVNIDSFDAHLLVASSEVRVHLAIYRNTSALSIIHAHPPYSVLLSFHEDELIPKDSEGSYILKRVPVLALERTVGAEEAASLVSEALRDYKVVLMRGHGSFARGDMMEEAYMLTTTLESSAFYLFHLKGNIKEYRKYSDKYEEW